MDYDDIGESLLASLEINKGVKELKKEGDSPPSQR